MSETATVAEGAPLSVEQAMGLLGPVAEAQAEQEGGSAEAVEEIPSEADPTADDVTDPETPAIEGEEEAEPESDPETPAIAAPKSWDAEERARFATLPKDVQSLIVNRETERDRAVSKAQQEASDQAKRTTQELAAIGEFKSKIAATLEQADQQFADVWSQVDWEALAAEDPQAYSINKERHAKAITAREQLRAAKASTEAAEFQSYIAAEKTKLPTVAPDLADPVKGAERLGKVGDFLLGIGYAASDLQRVSANDLAVAYDAYRWRQAQAGLIAKPKPTLTAATPAKPALKPTASTQAASPQQRNVDQMRNRLSQTRDVDDAVAYLQASRATRK